MGTDIKARAYLRVSKDRSGRLRSVDEQDDDARIAAAGAGWTLGEPYLEDGAVSASRYANGRRRPGFDRLVADLEAGRFAADVLILWEASRGSRRMSEWARFLEVLENRGVKVHVTSHGHTYDLTNPRDRRSLHEDGVDAAYESDKTSLRSRRSAARDAAAGKPGGRPPYGYRHPGTREGGMVVHEAEAAVVRELFDRVRRGHSIRAIATDLDARGVRNSSGRPFVAQHLSNMVRRPVYTGLRAYRGDEIEGTWPPIIDRQTWHAVRRLVSDPGRKTWRPGGARHLLSGVTFCDVCSGPLRTTFRDRGTAPYYQCHRSGHVRVKQGELDALAEAAILGYLARPDNVDRLVADDGNDAALAAVRDEIAQVRAELDDLADQVGRGDLSAALSARAEPAILERLRAAEAREADLSTPSQLRGLITPGADVARRWSAAPMSAKREVARMLLAPEVLGELRVTRSPTPGRACPVEERVTWRTS